MKNKILQSNCSETCYRLTGTLEDIKKDVLKMIDIVIKEDFSKENYPNGIPKNKKAKFDKIKRKIKRIRNLFEFELISFNFTSSYSTHFKEDREDIVIATSDDYGWEEDWYYLGQDGYYDVKDKNKFFITFEDDKYIIAQQLDKNDNVEKTICIDKKKKVKLEREWDNYGEDEFQSFKMFEKNSEYYVQNKNTKRLIKVKEVKDKNIIKQLETLISLGMGQK